MATQEPVVITGLGIVSCLGIGIDDFWSNLLNGESGIHVYDLFNEPLWNGPAEQRAAINRVLAPLCGRIDNFSAKDYVQPRKNIKLMSRDVQIGVVVGALALKNAVEGDVKLSEIVGPRRIGLDFGTTSIPSPIDDMTNLILKCLHNDQGERTPFCQDQWGEQMIEQMNPLWMLKFLPNMAACHIGIANDLQGPSNTLVLGDIGALSSTIEGTRAIQRGQADAMVVGGVACMLEPFVWMHHCMLEHASCVEDPAGACRPFDKRRDGTVFAEGAGACVIESKESAEKRGAKPLAAIRAWSQTNEPINNQYKITGKAIRSCLADCMEKAEITPDQLAHVNVHGRGYRYVDAVEAAAIADILGNVPAFSLKGVCGYAGSGSGAIELAASVRALNERIVPAARNFKEPDPNCPIQVVHDKPFETDKRFALTLNYDYTGTAVAMVLERLL